MRKYIAVLLVIATIVNCKVFAQGKAKHHKSTEHKHHATAHAKHAIPVHHAVVKKAGHTHHKGIVKKHVTAHHHHAVAVKHHHAARKHAAMRGETIVVDNHTSTAEVEVKNGNVYVNNDLVFKIKSLRNEDDKIMIDNISTPPAVGSSQGGRMMNDNSGKPMLGVYTWTYLNEGAMVEGMTPCSPACQAGLMPGDVIMKVDSHDVYNAQDLVNVIGEYNPGDKVTITYMHYGRLTTTDAELADKQSMNTPCPPRDNDMEMNEHEEKPAAQTENHRTFLHGRWRW